MATIVLSYLIERSDYGERNCEPVQVFPVTLNTTIFLPMWIMTIT